MDFTKSLRTAGEKLAATLNEKKARVVFAESCTGGLVSATLAQTPGVSQWHCGSAVTYRETTKSAWLKISPQDIAQHNAVSAEIARQMASGVLQITPEADWGASITGHLGPQAPVELDGVVYVALAKRESSGTIAALASRHQLSAADRLHRQCEAAQLVLEALAKAIAGGRL